MTTPFARTFNAGLWGAVALFLALEACHYGRQALVAPVVVTYVCASIAAADAYGEYRARDLAAGRIVLSIGCYTARGLPEPYTQQLLKIDWADEVVFLRGTEESILLLQYLTRARSSGKPVHEIWPAAGPRLFRRS